MKKLAVLGMGICVALSFSSCKSSESAYKKAYEKAKQQELAEAQTAVPTETETVQAVTSVTTVPHAAKVVESVPAPVRQEKVTVVTGTEDGLKDYSVVCGSFGIKANAEGVKQRLDNDGYHALVVYNAEINQYRVIACSFADRASAEEARDALKARYPHNADFQKAWLLYRIK